MDPDSAQLTKAERTLRKWEAFVRREPFTESATPYDWDTSLRTRLRVSGLAPDSTARLVVGARHLRVIPPSSRGRDGPSEPADFKSVIAKDISTAQAPVPLYREVALYNDRE